MQNIMEHKNVVKVWCDEKGAKEMEKEGKFENERMGRSGGVEISKGKKTERTRGERGEKYDEERKDVRRVIERRKRERNLEEKAGQG